MSFIDEIVVNGDLKSINVEEWNKDIYFKPFTLDDNDWIQKKANGQDGAFIAYFLIRKCLDADGKKVFTVSDKLKLTKSCDSDLLTRVMLEMRGETVDYEGN